MRSRGHARSARSVLVTGGSGYIGSHVVRALHEGGRHVVVLDRRPPRDEYLASLARFELGDVRDSALLHRLLAQYPVDGVIHIAGIKSVAESLLNPYMYFDVNSAGTLAVLDAAREAGVAWIVFSSSAAIYGTPDQLPINEEAPLRPANPYGESKALVERMLPWWDHCHGLRYVSLRYFNAAGASSDARLGEEWTDATNLIPLVMQAALGWRPTIEVFGTDYPTPDGTAVRDYIHVTDLAEAHLRALDHLASGGESTAVNLGTGRGVSVAEVIAATEQIAGQSVDVTRTARRAGDPAAVWADASLARKLLGWTARHGIQEIVESAWRWHVHHDGAPTSP